MAALYGGREPSEAAPSSREQGRGGLVTLAGLETGQFLGGAHRLREARDQSSPSEALLEHATSSRAARVSTDHGVMAPDGNVTIETANVRVPPFLPHPHGIVRRGRYAMLAMSATGWVIEEDARNRVFEPSLARRRQGRVTGMELACVYGIVKQCGGHIGVDSGREHGTTFRIYLPLVGLGNSGMASGEGRASVNCRSTGRLSG